MIKKYTFGALCEEFGVKDAERLAYIDFFFQFRGSLSRSDLSSFFGLKEAAASQTITQYRELRPENVEYERGVRKNVIVRASFQPLIELDAELALGMLANGFNKNKLFDGSLIPYIRIGNSPKKLNVELVAKVTRAISEKSAISCRYFSATSSNHSDRRLYPTAIFYDGISWMFRAYHKDLETNLGSYKCFDFARLISAIELPRIFAGSGEDLESDSDWHMITPIVLKPHPNLTDDQKKIVRYDFDITLDSDELIIKTRAVLFYYLVRQWKIDVRRNPIEKSCGGDEYTFHLQNRNTLEHFKCMEHVFKQFP